MCSSINYRGHLCVGSSNFFCFFTIYYTIKVYESESFKLKNTLKDFCDSDNG